MNVRLPPHRAGRTASPGRHAATGRAGLLAVIRRDCADRGFLRLPFVLDLVFATVNLAAFMLVTRWLAAGPQATVQERHVLVGLAFLLALQSGVLQVIQRIGQEQRTGSLEFQLASGVRPWTLIGGIVVVAGGIGQVRLVLYLILARLVLGLDLGRADWFGIAVVLLLAAALTAGIAAILASVALAMPGGATVGRVAVAALGLVSGVFVPIDRLRAPMSTVGAALPTTGAVDGLRAAVGGGPWWTTVGPLAASVVAVGAAAIAGCGVAVRVARRHARLVPS